MKQPLGFVLAGLLGISVGSLSGGVTVASASEHSEESAETLKVVYPPNAHETTSDQIFLIGTAPTDGEVRVNGEVIERSAAGHFAPSFPLEVGENVFVLEFQDQHIELSVTRVAIASPIPEGSTFVTESLYPPVDIARLPGEPICFEAIAPPNAEVSVQLANQTISLQASNDQITLPPNSAVLTQQNAPIDVALPQAATYQGCQSFSRPGRLGVSTYRLSHDGQSHTQSAAGTIDILDPTTPQIAEVTASSGAARTGPSTNYSRLTPLPPGTQATVTGRESNWYRLDYGVWIRDTDVTIRPGAVPTRSLIRSIRSRQVDGWTEILFPLQVPVPVSVDQGDETFTLTLHNTTAQTDTIFVDSDPIIRRLDWTQPTPDQVRYTFRLTSDQQWGYRLRYEGTTLVLALRHPPDVSPELNDLRGVSILLDPGHGGEELGARGPTGLPEKTVNLAVSSLLRDELEQRGATVYMTREEDVPLSLGDRIDLINQLEPTLALSIHYNALPDNGDAINTDGIGMFWYHPQAHNLSVFLHDYLTETLDRPSYGVFWNNLALTRPSVAPSVLLELGFMINPTEFEWIVDEQEQQRLAGAIADGLAEWLSRQ
ncbi:MAG: N-acetylmuramoyl-L-alanine amidase [Leptolyngbyaceae bacterium]|nr:N-acetylmuramoyl-L-alanine amidase [Leptolyngbyaceae bacterium]